MLGFLKRVSSRREICMDTTMGCCSTRSFRRGNMNIMNLGNGCCLFVSRTIKLVLCIYQTAWRNLMGNCIIIDKIFLQNSICYSRSMTSKLWDWTQLWGWRLKHTVKMPTPNLYRMLSLKTSLTWIENICWRIDSEKHRGVGKNVSYLRIFL